MTGPLFVVERDSQVAVYATDDGDQSIWMLQQRHENALAVAASADGQLLLSAFAAGDGSRAHLEYVAASGERSLVPGSEREGVVAPGLPFYATWAPSGVHASFVANDGQQLVLYAWTPRAGTAPTQVTVGGPTFHVWSPGGSVLAVHTGEDLSLAPPDGGEAIVVTREAAGFRVPAWSHDGALLAWGKLSNEGTEIHVYEDGVSRALRRFGGGVALAFRPGTRELTVAVEGGTGDGSFSGLYSLSDSPNLPPKKLSGGPLIAFAWSPASDRLAVVHPTQAGDGRYAVRIVDPEGRFLGATEAFFPSTVSRLSLGFFDQYNGSHPWWEPRGRGLVFCGRLGGDGVSDSFGDPEGGHALWSSGERGQPLVLVGQGSSAFFSAPPPAATPM
ncbi:MAG TPA: hypothetical protein QGF35_07400 [Dehalococcoidia bacterium]|nr:hypothetical protein [Dehalococcoidia bacterium]